VERRGDLCGDGGGRAAGVTLNHYFGISGFATVVVLVAAIGLLFARTRQDVSVTAGVRAPFHAVVRKIWPYGLGLAFGTVGFGVIATFITLYFAAHSWQGAAFTLSLFSVGFICVRLVLGNTITRYGGVPVSWPASSSNVSACCLSGWRRQPGGRHRRLPHRLGFFAGLPGVGG
jgi:hypothetical protein